MNTKFFKSLFYYFILAFYITLVPSCHQPQEKVPPQTVYINITDTARQKAFLSKIISLLPADRTSRSGEVFAPGGRVSFLDDTFKDWVSRTGELPPDFNSIPSIPFLPDPLVLDEGGKNIPVKSMRQWKEKRSSIIKQLEYYITGTCPPVPDNLKAEILTDKKDGEISLKSFGK